jgi:DNA polymerase-4
MRSSVGIAPNTLLAKLASDMHKPDGLTVLEHHDVPQRLLGLKLSDINGIGPRMIDRLAACGITSVAELYAAPRDLLRTAWGGVAGVDMYDKLRGQWYGPRETVARSLGHSHVLPPNLRTSMGALAVLHRLTQKAAMRLRAQHVYATSMSVHVRCERPRQAATQWRRGDERWTHLAETQDTSLLLHTLDTLWHSGLDHLTRPKAVGIQLHGLVPAAQHTPDLFDEAAGIGALRTQARDRSRLLHTIDSLNRKHGKNTIYFASAQAGLDHAPMRIAFNRIPDLDSER